MPLRIAATVGTIFAISLLCASDTVEPKAVSQLRTAATPSPRSAASVGNVALTRVWVPLDPFHNLDQFETVFLTIDPQVCMLFTYSGVAESDTFYWEFVQPNGQSYGRTSLPAGSSTYLWAVAISGTPMADSPGKWRWRLVNNGIELTGIPFEIRLPPADPVTILSRTLLPAGAVGKEYFFTLSAAGGQPPYTWKASGLPVGLSVSPAGEFSGTPKGQGNRNVFIEVEDSAGAKSARTFGIAINPMYVIPTPARLTFFAEAGGTAPTSLPLALESNTIPIKFSAIGNGSGVRPWIKVAPAVGSTPGTVSVSVDATGFSADTYQGTIAVEAQDAPLGQATVPVTLIVKPKGTAIPKPGAISTYAGSQWRFSGNGAPATQAPLGSIYGLHVDSADRPYFADADNAIVGRIEPDGTLTVLAGNGLSAFAGDGGPALAASLQAPQDAVFDSVGNLYIAENATFRIRRVTLDGVIATFGGIGFSGFFGDGGPAIYARLRALSLLADSSGNLYFQGDARIRKIGPDAILTTIAGTGQASYSNDGGPALSAAINPSRGNLALDAQGNLFIADTNNHRIRVIDADGNINTFAGSGRAGFVGEKTPASAASFNFPRGLAFDTAGNLYVADANNHRVRMIDTSGTITTVAGNGRAGFTGDGGPALAASLNTPTAVAVASDGTIYIADSLNFRIRRVLPDGSIDTVAGNGMLWNVPDGTPAAAAYFNQPDRVAFGPDGTLYVADALANRIRKITPDGAFSTLAGQPFAGFANGDAKTALFNSPASALPDRNGNVYVSDYNNHRVRRINADGSVITVAGDGVGRYAGDDGPAERASLLRPNGLALDAAGNLYIADEGNNRVRRVSNGIITTVAGPGTAGTLGDTGKAVNANLAAPYDVAIDGKGNLLIADLNNRRIRRVTPDGVISTIAGTGVRSSTGDGGQASRATLADPSSLAVDAAGNIYVAERLTHTVRRIAVDGTIMTVAGGNGAGFSGDGAPATAARLSLARCGGLAVDAAGNLFIADGNNDRIRIVTPAK